jgi:hypothetical protein
MGRGGAIIGTRPPRSRQPLVHVPTLDQSAIPSSRSRLSRTRSLLFARRIMKDMKAVISAEKPDGRLPFDGLDINIPHRHIVRIRCKAGDKVPWPVDDETRGDVNCHIDPSVSCHLAHHTRAC